MICEKLVSSSNARGMGSAISYPLEVCGQNAIHMPENSVQFNTFGVQHKQTVELEV